MIDGRLLLAGGAVLVMAGLAKSAWQTSAKHLAIDGVELPASFNGVLALGCGGADMIDSTVVSAHHCAPVARLSRHNAGGCGADAGSARDDGAG